MNLQSKVKKLADKEFASTRKIRRHLHQYPELSYQEKETGKYIAATLKSLGIKYKTGWAENGIVAIIQGKKSNKRVIALRADIDALPITEANKVAYKSKHKGVMHACGHDVHTASLLGTAKILNELKDDFGGTLKLIFQPAEEKLPGGASILIKEGVLKNPKPISICLLYTSPSPRD